MLSKQPSRLIIAEPVRAPTVSPKPADDLRRTTREAPATPRPQVARTA
jgi:hypothetical protein